MLTQFGSVLPQYVPTWRTAITWVPVARAKATVRMADNRTQAILPTAETEDNPMAGPACLKAPTAIRALRLAAVG